MQKRLASSRMSSIVLAPGAVVGGSGSNTVFVQGNGETGILTPAVSEGTLPFANVLPPDGTLPLPIGQRPR